MQDDITYELYQIESEILRRKWRRDPARWIHDRLGEHVWSKQREILRSVRDKRRTAVHSCHDSGKSFIAARIAAWWIDTHPLGEAFVITSAPTARQVRAILWREIGRAHAKGLPGRTNQTEWFVTMPNGKEELVALGMKPSDTDPAAFQGFRARYLLVIFDEACGIPSNLWDAADSMISTKDSRFLAIGNPDDPDSEFAKVCSPGSGWNVIGIDAFDTPNFTDEIIPEHLSNILISKIWTDEKRRKWGEDNPLWIAKIRGRFPENTKDGLIPLSWIKAAQLRELDPVGTGELGVDVGGGRDKNTIAHARGPVVRIIWRDQNPDTMQTCGRVIIVLNETKALVAKVDEIGIGRGVVDRGREQGKPFVGINVGRKAKNEEAYTNLRAEGYWNLRERFQNGSIDIDPDDDDLAAQLVDLTYKPVSGGKIQVVSKEELRKKLGRSPDDADAVMLACLPDELCGALPVRKVAIEWG